MNLTVIQSLQQGFRYIAGRPVTAGLFIKNENIFQYDAFPVIQTIHMRDV